MMPRSFDESLVDRLLTLFLIAETRRKGWSISGKVKFLKMIYLSELRMVKDKLKGFSYTFYKWKFGPMSNDALEDYEWLIENDLIKEAEYRIYLTDRGLEILKNSAELLNRNENVLNYIRKVIDEFAPYPGKRIKTVVYDLPKIGEKRIIRKIEAGEELLSRITKEEAEKRFFIDEEWLETLSIMMNKKFYESLERGIKDAREGRIERYEPLQ